MTNSEKEDKITNSTNSQSAVKARNLRSNDKVGKELIAWHLQRPILSYSETKIFDVYFNQLFKKDYPAEDVQALHELHDAVMSRWTPDNPMGLNESLLTMKAYAPFHHLFAISVIFSEFSNSGVL